MKIMSDSNLHNGDSFTLRLSDAYNKPINNKSVEIIVTDVLGEKNSFNVTTDDCGENTFGINVTPGIYSFDCVFSGDSNYKQSSTSQNISVCDY